MEKKSAKGTYKTTLSSSHQDGRMLINFGDGDMEVFADFIPAASKGMELTEVYAKNLLEKMNIVNGVFWDRINDSIVECNESGRTLKNILIARGDIPVDEMNAYFRLDDVIKKPAPPRFEEGGQTNYRAFSPFIIVHKGQCLAGLRDAVAGISGKTVHGQTVPFNTVSHESVSPGKNTYSDGKRICAEVSGQLIIKNNVLTVEPTLVVRGAVGYATGNINFPGDVVLEGPVNDGFCVNVGGSLTVRETLDVTDVVVRNDLNVSGGMIGRGRALVKVSGALKAKFIQNCSIACKKSITVTTEVINSTFYTMDTFSVGDKGTILGGEIFAFHSVSAGRIGKEHSLPVKIHLGSDWTLRQDLAQNETMMRMIHAKIRKVAEYIAAAGSDADKLAKGEAIRSRLEEEAMKCEQKKNELLKRYTIDPGAFLLCSGTLATGTIVEICGIEFIASEPLHKIRLSLADSGSSLVVS